MRETIFPELQLGYNNPNKYMTNKEEVRIRFTIKDEVVATIAETPANYIQPLHYHNEKNETIFFIKGTGKIIYYVENNKYEKLLGGPAMVRFYPGISHTIEAITEFPNFSIKKFTQNDYGLGINKNKIHPYIHLFYIQEKGIRVTHYPDGDYKTKVGVYILSQQKNLKILESLNTYKSLIIAYIRGEMIINNNIYENGILKIENGLPFRLKDIKIDKLNYGIILKTSSS